MTADKKFVIDEICKFSFLKPGHPVHVCIQSPPDKAVVWPYNCPHTLHCKGVRTKTYKKSPYDMVGEVSECCLLITSPVRTSHLRPCPMSRSKLFSELSTVVIITCRKPQRSSCPWIALISHRSGQPASRQSQGCCIRWIIVAATW